MVGKLSVTYARLAQLGVLVLIGLGLLSCQSTTPAVATATRAAAAPAATQAPQPQATAQPQAPAPAATQAPAAQAPQETLKVGISTAMSGPGANTGLNVTRFIQLGIDDVNAKGGVKVGGKSYRLESVVVDDKFTSEGGREAANKLVLAERVRFILGMGSSPLGGGQAVIDQAKVLVLGGSALDQSLGPDHPLAFAVGSPHIRSRSQVIYDWLVKERPNVKRVAITANDNANGKLTATISGETAKQRGLTVVATELYPTETKDFGPLVTRVLREKPDGVEAMGGGQGPLFLALMQALAEQGFKGQAYGSVGDDSLTKGLPYLEGYAAGGLVDWRAPIVGAALRDAIERYIAKHGEQGMSLASVANYNMAPLLAQALEKAGTVEDTEKVAKVLREGEWDTVWSKELGKSRFVGAKTFGLASVLEQPTYISMVEKGKGVTSKVIMATLP